MRRNPLYTFKNLDSTGIYNVPMHSTIQIGNTSEVPDNKPRTVQLISKTGMSDPMMTIRTFLANPNWYIDTNESTEIPSELEKIKGRMDNTGWRILGRKPEYYGDIGRDAFDFSKSLTSNILSNTLGATGEFSFAIGYETTAKGYSSFATGVGTLANNKFSTSMGRYNIGIGAENLFEFGCGLSVNERRNALEINAEGVIKAPELSIDRINLAGNSVLITKEYSDNNLGDKYEKIGGPIAGDVIIKGNNPLVDYSLIVEGIANFEQRVDFNNSIKTGIDTEGKSSLEFTDRNANARPRITWNTGINGFFTITGATSNSGPYKIWHAGNDGDGSGLDADLLQNFTPLELPVSVLTQDALNLKLNKLGNQTLDGNLSILHSVDIGDNLTVTGNIGAKDIKSDSLITNELNVHGKLTAFSLAVPKITGKTTFENEAIFEGDIIVDSNIIITPNTQLNSIIGFGSTTPNGASFGHHTTTNEFKVQLAGDTTQHTIWHAGNLNPSDYATTFLELDDTPKDYNSAANKILAVNANENAIEYITISSSGVGDVHLADDNIFTGNNTFNGTDKFKNLSSGSGSIDTLTSNRITTATLNSTGLLTATDITTTGLLTATDITTTDITTATLNSTGLLTATDITTTGLLTATDITTTGLLTATDITTTGLLTATDITTTGLLTATDITTTDLLTATLNSTGIHILKLDNNEAGLEVDGVSGSKLIWDANITTPGWSINGKEIWHAGNFIERKTFLDLDDTPLIYGNPGDSIVVNTSGDGFIFKTPGSTTGAADVYSAGNNIFSGTNVFDNELKTTKIIASDDITTTGNIDIAGDTTTVNITSTGNIDTVDVAATGNIIVDGDITTSGISTTSLSSTGIHALISSTSTGEAGLEVTALPESRLVWKDASLEWSINDHTIWHRGNLKIKDVIPNPPNISLIASGTADAATNKDKINELIKSLQKAGIIVYAPTAPSVITDLVATTSGTNQITFVWTDAGGYPRPTYKLVDAASTVIEANIWPGKNITIALPFTDTTYKIVATNTLSSVDSNTQTINAPTTATAITDFKASDLNIGEIYMTFTESFGETYDLYNSTGVVQANINSGYQYMIGAGTDDYYVQATVGIGGTPVASNPDSGTSL